MQISSAGLGCAATVLFAPLDSLQGWTVRTVGPTSVGLIDQPQAIRCVELVSRGGTVLLTRELPLEEVRGRRLQLSCLMSGQGVVRGPQVSSAAKLHLAVRTPAGVQHAQARLVGTVPWRQESFALAVPKDAQEVVGGLGLAACRGQARFARLVVRNDRRGVWPLDLAPAANADHEQLGLSAVPSEPVEWEGIVFHLLDRVRLGGLDCLRLRGTDHPDWPAKTGASIPVGRPATALYILQATLRQSGERESPCAIWTARFADGQEAHFSVFEGREIGPADATADLENWRIAWRSPESHDKRTCFGVTKWTIHHEAPLESISCRAYRGMSPVVLAVTAVEEPPVQRSRIADPEADEER